MILPSLHARARFLEKVTGWPAACAPLKPDGSLFAIVLRGRAPAPDSLAIAALGAAAATQREGVVRALHEEGGR